MSKRLPETCWAELIEQIIVASSWFFCITLPTLMMHGQTQIKFRKLTLCVCVCVLLDILIKLDTRNFFWKGIIMNFYSVQYILSSSLLSKKLKIKIYGVSQEERTKLREGVPYVKLYRYNPKHLYPKLNGFRDNGQRSLKLWQLLHTYWLPNSY